MSENKKLSENELDQINGGLVPRTQVKPTDTGIKDRNMTLYEQDGNVTPGTPKLRVPEEQIDDEKA